MIEVIDIKARMRSDLEAAGIDADKYFQQQIPEIVAIDGPSYSHSGSYLLPSGKRLTFVLSGPIWFEAASIDYGLLIRVRFDPVGIGWREIEIWEENLLRAKSGGSNMPQLTTSTRFSPGMKLDQVGIVISQDTSESLGVYFEATIEALPRRE